MGCHRQSAPTVQALTGDEQVCGLPPKFKDHASLIRQHPTQPIPMFDFRYPLFHWPAAFPPVTSPQ
jgi:hypothetical protein